MVGEKKKRKLALKNEEEMLSAVHAVVNDKLPILQVATERGIGYATLWRNVKKFKEAPPDSTIHLTPKYDTFKVFTDEQEQILVQYIRDSSVMAYGLNRFKTKKLAFQYAQKNKILIPESWKTFGLAGKKWLRGFLDRQHLSIRKPEACNLTRLTSCNKHNVNIFYDNLSTVLEQNPTVDGVHIWNLDETATTTVHIPESAVAPLEFKQVQQVTSGERGLLVTTCCIISASGTFLPPALIFPRKNVKSRMIKGPPSGTLGLATPSGWMTEEKFLDVFDHFIQHSGSSKENPHVLILDNHESHVSIDVIDKARDHGVIMLTLPPHCSHRIQPLDISVLGPFKTYYDSACNEYRYKNPGQPMTIYDLLPCINEALKKALTPTNIIMGFQKSGIFPYNRNIFSEADFLTCCCDRSPMSFE